MKIYESPEIEIEKIDIFTDVLTNSNPVPGVDDATAPTYQDEGDVNKDVVDADDFF